jgi:hypothetical protein
MAQGSKIHNTLVCPQYVHMLLMLNHHSHQSVGTRDFHQLQVTAWLIRLKMYSEFAVSLSL